MCTDPIITPEIFAQSLVDDYTLASNYKDLTTKSIQDQLSDYEAHSHESSSSPQALAEGIKGNLDDKDAEWWEGWRKRLKTPSSFVKSGLRQHAERRARKRRKVVVDDLEDAEDLEDQPMTLDEIAMGVSEDDPREDLRILIKVCCSLWSLLTTFTLLSSSILSWEE